MQIKTYTASWHCSIVLYSQGVFAYVFILGNRASNSANPLITITVACSIYRGLTCSTGTCCFSTSENTSMHRKFPLKYPNVTLSVISMAISSEIDLFNYNCPYQNTAKHLRLSIWVSLGHPNL